MDSHLKTRISALLDHINKTEKPNLYREIKQNYQKSCLKYSKEIWSYRPSTKIEPILIEALKKELGRVGYPRAEASRKAKYFTKTRTLQTAPHLTPTDKPRFFFINWLSSIGLKPKDYYLVAMFSGVPFSNKTRPGRITSSENEINLFPANMQDALVYRHTVPQKMTETLEKLPGGFHKIFPKTKVGSSYTGWALQSAKNLEKKYLGGKSVFFDFNEVATNYLALALEKKNHPISKLLFDSKHSSLLSKLFNDEFFFYENTIKDGKEVMQGFKLETNSLVGKHRSIKLSKENLEQELAHGLCPGLPLGFLIFAFLNQTQCLGSFAQVEYLPVYKKKFLKLKVLAKYKIKDAPDGALTTGAFPGNTNLHPLDLALGEEFTFDETTPYGEALLAIEDVLVGQNYSANMIK